MIIKTNKKSTIDIPESAHFQQGLLGFQQALPSLYMLENQPTLLFFSQTSFCHSLLYFPISSLSFLFFQSQCPISPTFNRHPSRTSHPKFPKPSLHTLFENPFIPTSSLSICTTSFFFPSSFGISHHQPWNSSLFNSSFSHKAGSYLS